MSQQKNPEFVFHWVNIDVVKEIEHTLLKEFDRVYFFIFSGEFPFNEINFAFEELESLIRSHIAA